MGVKSSRMIKHIQYLTREVKVKRLSRGVIENLIDEKKAFFIRDSEYHSVVLTIIAILYLYGNIINKMHNA